ncbi:MAG: 2'-5' RNA ligase [Candidatus Latescibacterota bacterium]|jgi:2'-5' RNA ligase
MRAFVGMRLPDAAAQELGWQAEARAFRPHLTLGRVHAARELPMGDEILALPDLSFMAVEVELIESRLHKRGAQYHMLYRARLGGG